MTDNLEKRKITFTDAGLVQKVEKAGEYTLTGSVTNNSNSVIVLNKDFGFEKFTFTDAGLVEKVEKAGNENVLGGTGLTGKTVTLLSKDFDFEEFTFTDAEKALWRTTSTIPPNMRRNSRRRVKMTR